MRNHPRSPLSHRPGLSGRGVISLLALAALALSCSGRRAAAPPPRILSPEGGVTTRRAAVCSPGRAWDAHPLGDHWRFRGHGAIHCWVASASHLEFLLVPDRFSDGFQIRASWDGKPLTPEPLTLSGEQISLEIPATGLTPGLHELLLERHYAPFSGPHPYPYDNGFVHLAYRTGDTEVPLDLSRLTRWRYLADFLALGLTGRTPTKRSGWLFDGPGSRTLEIASPAPSHIRLTVENASNAAATFRLDAGESRAERSLGPGQSARLELDLPAGDARLGLDVRGVPDGLYLWGSPELSPTAPRGRRRKLPPIVFISLDTTRRDALGAYNHRPEVTPNLDAFAREATVFEQAVATSSWTLPSHASMFTGLYPSQHGAGYTSLRLPRTSTTLALLLAQAGYLPAGFAGGEFCSARYGVGTGFREYRNPEGFETRGDHLTDQILEFLDGEPRQPPFLFINYFDAHALYRAPAPFQERLGVDRLRPALAGLPIWKRFDQGDVSAWREIIDGKAQRTPAALAYVRAAYLAEVAFDDHEIGRLFEALRRHDLYDDALIVIVGDHGELLGEGGHFSHAVLLEPELVEVPLLIKWPHQKQGYRVSQLVSGVDLFPTVLAAAGIAPPPSSGRALTRRGPAPGDARSFVIMEEHESAMHPFYPSMKVAAHLYGVERATSRRVVWDGGEECSSRRQGRWVPTPCGDDGAAVLAGLRQLLGAPHTDAAPTSALNEEERKALAALGYL